MTEMLHWYAETSGGVQTGNCTVTENGGALHLTADLPAGTLKAVRAEMPWTMEADERLFMNGYQTWTYSPELDRNGKLRGTDHIPGFLRKKYAFDRYGDYHFAPYGHQKGQSHGFSYCYFRKGTQFRLVASLDETPGYTILRYDSRKALLTLERVCRGRRDRGVRRLVSGYGHQAPDGEEAGRLFQLVQPLSGHHRGYHPGGSDRLPQPALPGRPVPDR